MQQSELMLNQPGGVGATPVEREDSTRIWCEDCLGLVKPPCSVHGELFPVKDRHIQSRARLSLPHNLAIKNLELRAGSDHDVSGVFAKKVIQKRTLFGPYEGMLTEEWKHHREDRIELKLFLPDGRDLYLDCTDECICNWMMFVRPAADIKEQNLVVFQYKGAVYFVSTKPIAPNEELKVWYAAHYAQQLRKKTLQQQEINDPETDVVTSDKVVTVKENLSPALSAASLPPTSPTPPPQTPVPEIPMPDIAVPYKVSEAAEDIKDPPVVMPDVCDDPVVMPDVCDDDADDEVDDAEDVTPPPDHVLIEPQIKTEVQSIETACQTCGREFETLQELAEHACGDDLEDLKDTEDGNWMPGRRTKNKRKGRPVKLKRGHLRRILNKQGKGVKKERKPTTEKSEAPIRRGARIRKVKTAGDESPELAVKVERKVKKEPTGKIGRPPVPNKKLHMCDICGKAFTNTSKLNIHKFQHSGEKPFQCTELGCNKSFVSKFKRERHLLVHTDLRQHSCCYCDKTFTRKDHLKNHMKVHDPNKALHHCEECGKDYASSFAYRTHLSLHAAHRGELTCLVCKNKKFDTTESLLHHLKVHSGARSIKSSSDKKYECGMCEKRFFTQKDVRRHMVTHTKSREFMCHFCPQCFGRRDHLVRHLAKTHKQQVELNPASQQTTDTDPSSSIVASAPAESSQQNQIKDTMVYDNSKVVSSLLQSVNRYMPIDQSELDTMLANDTEYIVEKVYPLNSQISPHAAIPSSSQNFQVYEDANTRSIESTLPQPQAMVDLAPQTLQAKFTMPTVQSQLMHTQGKPVGCTPGDATNMKITSQPLPLLAPNTQTLTSDLSGNFVTQGNFVVEGTQPNFPALVISYSDAMRMIGQFPDENT